MLFKKQPKIGREAMFKSKPVRNDQLSWEKNESDEIVVTLQRNDNWKVRVLSKLFWVPQQKTLVLDQIGAQVWDMCDGRTTVEHKFVVAALMAAVFGVIYLVRKDLKWDIFSLASVDEMGAVGRIEVAQGTPSVWHTLDALGSP